MNEKIIQINNLYKHFGKLEVLKGVDLDIYKGEVVSIIGSSGSGKSTLAKLIMGLLKPTSGEILIDGVILNEETVEDLRGKLGIVFQNPDNQFIGSTVEDDIAFGLENRCVDQKDMQGIIEEYANTPLFVIAKFSSKAPAFTIEYPKEKSTSMHAFNTSVA